MYHTWQFASLVAVGGQKPQSAAKVRLNHIDTSAGFDAWLGEFEAQSISQRM